MPHVVFKLVIKSGEASTPQGKEGLALFALNLLELGTTSRSYQQLETELLKAGAILSNRGLPDSSILTLVTATRRIEQALDLFADVALTPSFPDKELCELKRHWLAMLKSRSLNPRLISEDVISRLLYPPHHPYARSIFGTPESIESITREDIVAFYRQNFVPANAALVVVGDVSTDAIVPALEARFGKWPPGPIPPVPDLHLNRSSSVNPSIYLVDTPGAQQSVITVGRIATAVSGRSHYGLEILLKELSSRLASSLVDEKGCSYDVDSYLPRATVQPHG